MLRICGDYDEITSVKREKRQKIGSISPNRLNGMKKPVYLIVMRVRIKGWIATRFTDIRARDDVKKKRPANRPYVLTVIARPKGPRQSRGMVFKGWIATLRSR
jgi:hypothetical protein